MPAKVLSGKESAENLKYAFGNSGKKCLIVCSETSALKSGALDDVRATLESMNIEYEIFSKVTENPKTVICCEGGKLAREINADFVVGIGGGSPMDAAKAVCVYAANEHIIDDGIYSEKVKNKPLSLVLVGTTSGTGSEVSGVSVLTRTDGRKQSVGGENYYARYVIANPEYTYSMPFSVTVSTALDALCHSAEAMFSPKSDFLSREFSIISAKTIFPILKKIYVTGGLPSSDERDTLYYSSLYAGFALNKCGTGFPHGMGYALTEDYSVPHGKACAVFLPAYMDEAQKAQPDLCNAYFDAMKTEKDEFEKIILSLCDLNFKIPREKISNYEKRWETLKNYKNSPTDFNNHNSAELVKRLFGM